MPYFVLFIQLSAVVYGQENYITATSFKLLLPHNIEGFSVACSCVRLLDKHGWTWISNDRKTKKELDILAIDCSKLKSYHTTFPLSMEIRKVPSEWRDGIIVSFYKGKGPMSEHGSYRPISLSMPGTCVCCRDYVPY